jgi:hypothetical protein
MFEILRIHGMGFTQGQVAAMFKMNVSTLRYKFKKDGVRCCFKKKLDPEVQRTRLKRVQAGRDALRAMIKRLEQEQFHDHLYADSAEIGLCGDKCGTDIHQDIIFPNTSKVAVVKLKTLTGSSQSSAARVKSMVEVRFSKSI